MLSGFPVMSNPDRPLSHVYQSRTFTPRGRGRGLTRPSTYNANVREPHESTTLAVRGLQAAGHTNAATAFREPVAVQGPPPRPLPVNGLGDAIYIGDWIDLTTGQTLAHVHVFGRLHMHLYANVRVNSRLVGRAVLTGLGVDEPPLPRLQTAKINLRLASKTDSFKDVGTLWLCVQSETALTADILTVAYVPRSERVSVHVVRCNCYKD